MMNVILKSFIFTLIVFLLSLFICFIIINLILGCETWNQELWTQYNSCITPSQMLGFN